jgi:hypothetical protein
VEHRESFYEYVHSRDGEASRVVVRAWSSDEAQDSIRKVLRAQGTSVPGRVDARIVRPLARPGRVSRRRPEAIGGGPRQAV